MTARLWILGAADPEMTAIKTLLRDAGETVAYAVGPDGQRVHPGNAYRAEWVSTVVSGRIGHIYLVECDGLSIRRLAADEGAAVIAIDHHRPGDPGYGRPPEEFLAASSIGQVVSELGRLGSALLTNWGVGHCDDSCPAGTIIGWEDTPEVSIGEPGCNRNIPRDIVLTAAADHCLEAAYRGRCPGVDPDTLMRYRTEQRATFRGVPVEHVAAEIEAARRRIRQTITDAVAYTTADTHPLGAHCYDLADLRGDTIPELPEAACREGVAYLAAVRDRDGREKVTLGAASPDLVRRFTAGEIVPGLTGYYGDPARGFAGGYTSGIAMCMG